MSSIKAFRSPSDLVKFAARAKYIPQPDGSLRLALVQAFSAPVFSESGWESVEDPDDFKGKVFDALPDLEEPKEEPARLAADVERATRRARINAFDVILCNRDLDTFATFTYSPDSVDDRADYAEVYRKLDVWLSNRVQRHGLKYVIVPERHKSGAIHFHGILNSSALRLDAARHPSSGRLLKHAGRQIYNISDWSYGFTTAELIGAECADRDAVAKYIFKYMGKQSGEKIGGRYALIGGKQIGRPVYVYGDSPEELLAGAPVKYDRCVKIGDRLEYREFSLI